MTDDAPQMFSPGNPFLQTAVDATSMDAVLFCPRRYWYEIINGQRRSSVDLEFGGFIASAFEVYWKERFAGATKEDATIAAVRYALEATWNEDGTQWGGRFEDQWKCAGETKYRNAKGNVAKCPYSHKKVWLPGPAPDVCGECGSGVERSRNYLPDDPKKHRVNLIRAVIWYAEDQPARMKDGLHPYVFPDGTPAVELSWRLPLPWQSPYGDQYIVCGHFDYIGVFGSEMGPVDNKTTKKTLGGAYFNSYSPSTQIDTYDMAAPVLWPDLDFDWIALDAVQIMAEGVRTGRHFYRKSEEQKAEHMGSIRFALDLLERFAEEAKNREDSGEDITPAYPMNKRNCTICPFREVCSSDPEDRAAILEEKFVRNHWNPLENR